MNPLSQALASVPGLCQSCGKQGSMRSLAEVPVSGLGKEAWCACPPKKRGGPYVMPPGVVVQAIYETREQSAFREQCRLAGNAFIDAKNNLCTRWVRCGRGWRELPRGHAKREQLESAYASAKRALTKLQKVCPHTHRSLYDSSCCGCCHAEVRS